MDASQNPHSTDLDFREQMLYAVAYRVSEMQKVRPIVARAWVRDVMKFGTVSRHWAEVSMALMEMMKPLIGTFLPMIPRIVQGVVMTVQQQNQRGWDSEAAVELNQEGPAPE
jgi:hypothetical protein